MRSLCSVCLELDCECITFAGLPVERIPAGFALTGEQREPRAGELFTYAALDAPGHLPDAKFGKIVVMCRGTEGVGILDALAQATGHPRRIFGHVVARDEGSAGFWARVGGLENCWILRRTS